MRTWSSPLELDLDGQERLVPEEGFDGQDGSAVSEQVRGVAVTAPLRKRVGGGRPAAR